MRHVLIVNKILFRSLNITKSRTPQQCKMSSTTSRTYADAIDTLNTFQTPFAVIEARRKAGIRPDENSIREMKAYWARLGYTAEDLDRLNVIHVAGTKGKGSVCAFVSSILSQYNKKTTTTTEVTGGTDKGQPIKIGLLTSPHLIAVRERIRLGNQPLSEALFTKYFFEVYDRLSSPFPCSSSSSSSPSTGTGTEWLYPEDAEPGSKPIYSRYLTLLAFHVFLREGVDAAVIETGIGGEYDATNIVGRPLATGITTLGIDHVFVLGETVDKIAWHKAGIMKTACPAFAVEQVAFPSAEVVLRDRAAEKEVDLRIVGIDERLSFSSGGGGGGGAVAVQVRPDAAFQKRNASLAIALAETALQKIDPEGFNNSNNNDGGGRPRHLPVEFKNGIEQVVWRGRCEVKEEEGSKIRWHIDGAHTTDSLKMAGNWFAGECGPRSGPRVLIFNQQGRTEAIDFLDGLHSAAQREDGTSFDHVIFCTNVTYAATGYKRDFVNHQYDPEAIKKLTVQHTFAERWSQIDPKANVSVIPSIEEAINQARDITKSLKEGETVQVFITGSLHLVGGALGILEGADAL